MTLAGRFTVGADHPSLPGHFPCRPVVPGVVLLDETLAALLAAQPGARAAALPAVKFTRPVLPGQEVEVRCQPPQAGRIAFACLVAGEEVARGTVAIEAAPEPTT